MVKWVMVYDFNTMPAIFTNVSIKPTKEHSFDSIFNNMSLAILVNICANTKLKKMIE